ncbi:MAG TPA: hypothetical protein VFJ85_18045 [Acidimicrobiales bacterium]|nr:hypothetical protein [Acidimicrobiales bacterium]
MIALVWARGVIRAAIGTRGGERGNSVIEYALLLALVAIFCIGAITLVGGSTHDNLSSTASTLP